MAKKKIINHNHDNHNPHYDYENLREKVAHPYSKCYYCRLIYNDEFIKKIKTVFKDAEENGKSALERKMAIFDVLLEMDFGELSVSEKKRAEILLKSHLYGELAKKYLKEYKEKTVKEFSNN